MLKLLIVDDEPLMREGLRAIIDWEEYGFAICGEASDGVEALEAIERLRPHLALIDIRMPNMSGLELAALVHEKGLECHFIILSGYSAFTYAQEAIRHHVEAYLLKPIEEEILIETIVRVRKNILQENAVCRRASAYEIRAVQEAVLAFFNGGEDLPDCLPALFRMNNPEQHCLLALFTPGDMESLQSLLRCGDDAVLMKLNGDVLWIVSGEDCATQYAALPAEPYDGFFAAAEGTLCTESLRCLYALVRMQLKRDCFYGRHGKAGRMAAAPADDTSCFDKLAASVVNALVYRDMEDTRHALDALCHAVQEADASINITKTILLDTLMSVQRELPRVFPDVAITRYSLLLLTQEINEERSLALLKQRVEEMLATLSSEINRTKSGDLIARMILYIKRNYQRELYMDELSEVFQYNRAYLGRVFNAGVGMGFSAYLERMRMDKAKELLATTNMKVYQIVEAVGFRSSDYFYRQFQKYTNDSPNEYRKKRVRALERERQV